MKIKIGDKVTVWVADTINEGIVDRITADRIYIKFNTWQYGFRPKELAKALEDAVNPDKIQELPEIEIPYEPKRSYWHFFATDVDDVGGEIERYIEAKDEETAVKEISLERQLDCFDDAFVRKHLEEISREVFEANQ